MEIFASRPGYKREGVITTLVMVVVTFVLLMAVQYFWAKRDLGEELQTQSLIIATNSSAALAFGDQAAATENLSVIHQTKHILGAALYLPSGEQFVAVNDSAVVFPSHFFPESTEASVLEQFGTGGFSGIQIEAVNQGNTRVGTLLLLVTHKSLYLNLLYFAVALLVIGVIAVVIARKFTAKLREKMLLTQDQLEQMTFYDRITGLPNRRLFGYELKRAITRVAREGKCAALLLVDVDDFKKVNDLVGHAMGDEILAMIAARLRNVIRTDDILSRVGGDEFAAILFMVGDPENVSRLAEEMVASMSEPFQTDPIPSYVGVSIGVVMITGEETDSDMLARWAEMAMYEAKSHGKNQSLFYSSSINQKIRESLTVEATLRQALMNDDGRLYLTYQPQVDAKDRGIVGVEVLARLNSFEGSPIPPSVFIPIAEKSGLIVDLGGWLIRKTCEEMGWLKKQGIVLPKIAINLSPRELLQGMAFVETACKTVEAFSQSTSAYQFEITENALMADGGAEVMAGLSQAGFSLAIDDFGTGYSSLGYLKKFQVETLKIDQSFVQRLPNDANDATIVSAVIKMAKALEITVVAEGVETEEQAQFLRMHGCDTLQGYLISRPIRCQDFLEFALRYAQKS